MANDLQQVRPGDVISSDLINKILTKLQELEQKIGTGQGSSVVITGFDPANQIPVGQPLTILGAGFPSPPTASTVTLNATPASPATAVSVPVENYLFGSSGTKLKFVVPPVPGVASSPVQVMVSIQGAFGPPATATYTLQPSQASGPPAAISQVKDNVTNVVNILGIGHKIQITGQNFAPAPGTGNVITFTFTPQGGGSPVVYPKQGQSLTIDPSSTPTQIIVTVPDITEITQNMGTVAVSLSVANGTNTPAIVGVQVFRP